MSTADSTGGPPLLNVRLDLPHQKSHSDNIERVLHGAQTAKLDDCVRSGYFRWKPLVEWCLTLVLLILILPLLAIVSALVVLFDGRPIFYRQVRVGKNHRLFFIWKFRTMFENAEKTTGPVWSSQNDNRVTKLGRWLRATHLDELPQILNIIEGHMHLVGPRPERPEFVKTLIQDIPGYDCRHAVRPGITGLAQVKQGYDSCVGDVANKVALDVAYIETASLSQDLKILLLTIPYVVGEVWSAIRTRMPLGNLSKPALHEHAQKSGSVRLAELGAESEMSLALQLQREIDNQIELVKRVATATSSIAHPSIAHPSLAPWQSRERSIQNATH